MKICIGQASPSTLKNIIFKTQILTLFKNGLNGLNFNGVYDKELYCDHF